MWMTQFLCPIPISIQVWGITSFISVRSFHNPHFDKRNQLHTFFLYNQPFGGVGVAISKIVMGKRYIVEEIEENSEKGGCGRILLGIIAAGVLLFVGVENNDKEHEDSTPIQRETSVETRIKNYKANEETSIEQLILTNSLEEEEEERVEAYEESQSDEFQLNEQDVEDCEEVENVKTEYVEEQMTSKEQRKADREQRKADRKERREIKRKSKQTE